MSEYNIDCPRCECPVPVQYDYHPEEPRTHDHPGCPAAADVTENEVTCTTCGYTWKIENEDLDALEEEIVESREAIECPECGEYFDGRTASPSGLCPDCINEYKIQKHRELRRHNRLHGPGSM